MARKLTPLSKMDPAARAKRVAQLVGNPNTRAAVPDKYLSGSMLKQRQAAQAAKTPVVPGSSLTNGQLSQQAASASTVRYGDAQTQANQAIRQGQQTEADTGAWFNDYQQKLAQSQGNVQAIGKAESDAITQLANGPQPQAAPDANTPEAQAGARVRQALLGAQAAQSVTNSANANRYADTLANVVGPGQKLSALSQARGKTQTAREALGSLLKQEGAYRDQFMAQGKADEAKNVLATQALTNTATKATNDATYKNAQIDIKRGVDPVTGKRLPGKPGNPYSSGAFAGYTPAEVRKMSPGRKDQLKSDYQRGQHAPKAAKPVAPDKQYANDFYKKYGIKPATQQEVVKARDTVGSAGNWVRTVLSSNPGMNRAQLAQLLLNGQAANVKAGITAIPAQPQLWLTVALDQHFMHGYISNGTADKLHHAGYSVKGLGLQTRGAPTGAAAYPTGQAPGGGH